MADESSAGEPNVTVTMEKLQQALKDSHAMNKRSSEALDDHGQRTDRILAQLGSLQQAIQAPKPGLSEEAKMARIAPRKAPFVHSEEHKRFDCLFLTSNAAVCA